MKIKFLKAEEGDSILISFLDENVPRNILIDGGVSKTYWPKKDDHGKTSALYETMDKLRENNEIIDLLIVTHVDHDHIGGIKKWFEKEPEAFKMVGKVWFNSGKLIADFFNMEENVQNDVEMNISTDGRTSIGEGIKLEEYLLLHKIWEKQIIKTGQEFNKFGITFKLLSPSSEKLKRLLAKWEEEHPDNLTSAKENDYDMTLKMHIENDNFVEDNAVPNGSSIAFIMTYQGKNLLFLADAHPSVIAESLSHLGYSKENPIIAEFVKASHHGSKSNNSREMLEMIQSDNFIISTNGKKNNHPNKQFLARLIDVNNNCNIYFNYPEQINKIFKEEDMHFGNFRALAIPDNDFNI